VYLGAAIETFETSLALDLSLLRRLRRELAAWLERLEVPDAISDDIVLATHEAAANAIEHARLGTEITVRISRADSKIDVLVSNIGGWGEPRSLDQMRGRGLAIMNHVMSDLEVQSLSQRTVIRMHKELSSTGTRSARRRLRRNNEQLERGVR
jgi:anti-sigma regulatory factor (Ser/Thr protein kinase)